MSLSIFQADAKLEESVSFLPFSGSTEYKKVYKGTYLEGKRYVVSTARCNVYLARLKHDAMNRLSEYFVHAVNSLPLDDYAPYLLFISVFGTHYVSSVVMGAKVIVRSEFENSAWNDLNSEGFDIDDAAAKFFFDVGVKVGCYMLNVTIDTDSRQCC